MLFSLFYFLTVFKAFHGQYLLLIRGLHLYPCGALRILIRVVSQKAHGLGKNGRQLIGRNENKRKPVLIVGAGNAGEKTMRELWDNPHLNMQVDGFVDDAADKRGRSIHGVPVLGGVKELSELVKISSY